MTINSRYLNTDLDLVSVSPFNTLNRELNLTCDVLHYMQGTDGLWYSTVEASHKETTPDRDAATDILAMIAGIHSLSSTARSEFDACSMRNFNIGFDCGDTWAYGHHVTPDVVRAIADVECSLGVTLYPMRNEDSSLKDTIDE